MGLEENNYIVMTLHRPANVDEERILKKLMDEIIENSNNIFEPCFKLWLLFLGDLQDKVPKCLP